MEVAVRTLNNDIELIKKHLEKSKLKTSRILVNREFGKENKNEHYHYYIEISHGMQKDESICKGIRRILYKHYGKTNYYVGKVRDKFKAQVYNTKDGEIVYKEGYSDDELNELISANEEIEKDKALPIYQKLYNRIYDIAFNDEQSLNQLCMDKRWIVKRILEIYKSWDKPPPTRSNMFQYVNYIMSKADLEDMVVESYV